MKVPHLVTNEFTFPGLGRSASAGYAVERWLLYRYLSSFRLRSAPKIFNATADALEWIIASEGENWLNLLFIILTTFCLVAAQTRTPA